MGDTGNENNSGWSIQNRAGWSDQRFTILSWVSGIDPPEAGTVLEIYAIE